MGMTIMTSTQLPEVTFRTSSAFFVSFVVPPSLLLDGLIWLITTYVTIPFLITAESNITVETFPHTIIQSVSLTLWISCMLLDNMADQQRTAFKCLRTLVTLHPFLLVS
jgi:hypothetical protein